MICLFIPELVKAASDPLDLDERTVLEQISQELQDKFDVLEK